METTFNNFLEFLKAFPDNEACHKHLTEIRWPDKPICPYCDNDKLYIISPNNYKCKNKECNKKFNVFTGSIFENTKIPLPKWFYAIYIFTSHKKGISSHQLAKDITVTQKTAWFILGRVREMLKDKAPLMLEGTVSVDESYFGGAESNKHKSQYAKKEKRLAIQAGTRKIGGGVGDKTPVIGLIEQNGRVVNKVIQKATKAAIFPIITSHVRRGSIMVTDDFSMYKSIPSQLGYTHRSVNHKYGQYQHEGFTTNGIENYWSHLKRGVYGVYHCVSAKHLQRYCDEFAFRFNTRKSNETDRFNLALSQAGRRLTYNDYIADKED